MKRYHLFVSSNIIRCNGYQASADTVEEAEQHLPRLNETVHGTMEGRLYETQADGSLQEVRIYFRDPKVFPDTCWRAQPLNENERGKSYFPHDDAPPNANPRSLPFQRRYA